MSLYNYERPSLNAGHMTIDEAVAYIDASVARVAADYIDTVVYTPPKFIAMTNAESHPSRRNRTW